MIELLSRDQAVEIGGIGPPDRVSHAHLPNPSVRVRHGLGEGGRPGSTIRCGPLQLHESVSVVLGIGFVLSLCGKRILSALIRSGNGIFCSREKRRLAGKFYL